MDLAHLIKTGDTAFERLLLTNHDVQKAYAYADAAHSADDQRRWGGDPYIVHPRMVAGILLMALPNAAGEHEPSFYGPIQAALLHDVIEDTHCTAEDLLRHFTGEVVGLVEELSEPDDPIHWKQFGYDGRPNRHIRRSLEADRRGTISATAQTISCADMIANSHDIITAASHDFALLYQSELSERLDKMTRADPALRQIARTVLNENLATLREKPRETT